MFLVSDNLVVRWKLFDALWRQRSALGLFWPICSPLPQHRPVSQSLSLSRQISFCKMCVFLWNLTLILNHNVTDLIWTYVFKREILSRQISFCKTCVHLWNLTLTLNHNVAPAGCSLLFPQRILIPLLYLGWWLWQFCRYRLHCTNFDISQMLPISYQSLNGAI